MKTVLTKRDLYNRMDRLLADPVRPISIKLLADLAGLSDFTIKMVFQLKKMPMSETTQIRMSKALLRLQNGEIEIVQHRDLTREVRYVKNPRPRIRRSYGLTVVDGEIKLKIGLRNRSDYSKPTFEELMKG
jgi:AraC-like DNA-binding protein